MSAAAMPDESVVLDALRRVIDPEVGLNVVELGLVYGVQIGTAAEGAAGGADSGAEGAAPPGVRAQVQVQMTMTSAACPVTEWLVEQARSELAAALPPGTTVQVDLVWDPPWSPEKMSELARSQLGWAPR